MFYKMKLISILDFVACLLALGNVSCSQNQINHPLCGNVQRQVGSSQGRIIGGREAVPNSWPWQVYVKCFDGAGGQGICAGTIIGSRYVLTAAHCLTDTMSIVAGIHNIADREFRRQERHVVKAIPHPSFRKKQYGYDIALLILHRPLRLNRQVWPACLPSQGVEVRPGTMSKIIGWGGNSRKSKRIYGILQEASIPVVDSSECERKFMELEPDVLCAGYGDGHASTYYGDSGGSLLVRENNRWMLYGITSFGHKNLGTYDGFTKTSSHITWINQTISLHKLRNTPKLNHLD